MEPLNRMFYWTFYSVSNRYTEPSKRILLAVILEKVQHFSWKVQHAFVIAKRSPLYRVYIHALSVHTKSLFLRHFTRIGWDEGGGAVQCSPPPLRPQPSLGVSCFLITVQPGQWSVSGLERGDCCVTYILEVDICPLLSLETPAHGAASVASLARLDTPRYCHWQPLISHLEVPS